MDKNIQSKESAGKMSQQMGKITQVIGPVVDVTFPQGSEIPAIFNALEVQEIPEGQKDRVVLEVQSQLPGNIVRTVAMSSTDGLRRGSDVLDTGKAIAVSVGEATLGRMFSVL